MSLKRFQEIVNNLCQTLAVMFFISSCTFEEFQKIRKFWKFFQNITKKIENDS